MLEMVPVVSMNSKSAEVIQMSKKKQCSGEVMSGCTRPVQKDGLCYRCYVMKKGVAPFKGMRGPAGGAMPKQHEEEKTVVAQLSGITLSQEEHTAINVLFDDHPELLEKLSAMAKADYRTEGQQILFLISQADKIIEQAAR